MAPWVTAHRLARRFRGGGDTMTGGPLALAFPQPRLRLVDAHVGLTEGNRQRDPELAWPAVPDLDGMRAGDQRSRRQRRGRHSADVRQGGEAEVRALATRWRSSRTAASRLCIAASSWAGVCRAVPGRRRWPDSSPPAPPPATTRAPPGSAQREPAARTRRRCTHRATSTGSWSIREGCPAQPKHTHAGQRTKAGRRPDRRPPDYRTTGGHRLWPAAIGSPGHSCMRAQVVAGRVLLRGRAIGEGAQHIRGYPAGETAALGGHAPAVERRAEGLDPAHGAGVEDPGAAVMGVVGGVRVAIDAMAGQRRMRRGSGSAAAPGSRD